jgi:GxxExxY protein
MTQMSQIPGTTAGTERDAQTCGVIGVGSAARRELGLGALEPVHQEALALKFRLRGIPFEREVRRPVRYRKMLLKTSYRVGFICFEALLVELKASQSLSSLAEAQIMNDLKASGPRSGLLLEFGGPSLDYTRLVLNLREST